MQIGFSGTGVFGLASLPVAVGDPAILIFVLVQTVGAAPLILIFRAIGSWVGLVSASLGWGLTASNPDIQGYSPVGQASLG